MQLQPVFTFDPEGTIYSSFSIISSAVSTGTKLCKIIYTQCHEEGFTEAGGWKARKEIYNIEYDPYTL